MKNIGFALVVLISVITLAGCGSGNTTTSVSIPEGVTIPDSPNQPTVEATSTSGATSASGTSRDKKGDQPPELDLVRFSARRAGNEVVMNWTLAAPPNGTLVAAMSDEGIIAAVKIYEGGVDVEPPTAWVFVDMESKFLDSYSINGNVVTLRVPDTDLGLGFTTLEPSTERVGGRQADTGKKVAVP